MSDRTTLPSAMTVRSMILACSALLSSSVLWADSALGTDCRHDSRTRNQQDFAKNNPKICLLGHNKNWAE